MFLFKSILLFFILLLVFGLFSILSLAGAIRSLFFGNRDQTRGERTTDNSRSQTTTQSNQPQQQRKIYSKDEGEYVDFTEV